MHADWARLMHNWETEKLSFEEEIAAKTLETQWIKAENSDLIRQNADQTQERSELRRQIRGSVLTPAAPAASAASMDPVTAESVVAISASGNYRPKGSNPKQPLDGNSANAYSPWAFTVRGKTNTDAPIYPNEHEKVKYALSQMTNPIFDALHTWVIDALARLSP